MVNVSPAVAAPRRVLIMAAGTGGHVFPALAVARELQARGVEVHWLATRQGMEHRLLADAGIPLYPIDIQGVRGNGLLRLLKTPLMLLATTVAAMGLIRRLVGLNLALGLFTVAIATLGRGL